MYKTLQLELHFKHGIFMKRKRIMKRNKQHKYNIQEHEMKIIEAKKGTRFPKGLIECDVRAERSTD